MDQRQVQQRSIKSVESTFSERKKEKNNYDSLLLAIGSYIWGSIVPCAIYLKEFVDESTVYAIIDVIDIASSPVRCLFLGLLTDICENIFCGHYLCTWRGVDKNKGFISLLAMIWREEEREIGVKKRLDGSIAGESRRSIVDEQFFTYDLFHLYRHRITSDGSQTMVRNLS